MQVLGAISIEAEQGVPAADATVFARFSVRTDPEDAPHVGIELEPVIPGKKIAPVNLELRDGAFTNAKMIDGHFVTNPMIPYAPTYKLSIKPYWEGLLLVPPAYHDVQVNQDNEQLYLRWSPAREPEVKAFPLVYTENHQRTYPISGYDTSDNGKRRLESEITFPRDEGYRVVVSRSRELRIPADRKNLPEVSVLVHIEKYLILSGPPRGKDLLAKESTFSVRV